MYYHSTTDPKEITSEDWYAALGESVPDDWRTVGKNQVFKLNEACTKTLTTTFVMLDYRYFSFIGRIDATFDTSIAAVERVIAAEDKPVVNGYEVFSERWFNERCFVGMPLVPADVRALAKQLCVEFNVRGVCDPGYIANVISMCIGAGDGNSNWYTVRKSYAEVPKKYLGHLLDERPECAAEAIANKLEGAYETFRGKRSEVIRIINASGISQP